MTGVEEALTFACHGDTLVGVLHRGAADAACGLVVVVGGPQYRIGSHRQFVELARAVAAAGIPVLRFDVRGMGDSGGDHPGFEALDDDIRAAVDALAAAEPGLESVALWGLCDAASAICCYAAQDPRIKGAVLLNPWVRTETTFAQTQLRHYYTGRLRDADFWKKLLTLRLDVRDTFGSLGRTLRGLFAGGGGRGGAAPATLPDRMAHGMERFDGKLLLVMSGKDLTAREFEDAAAASSRWRAVFARPGFARHDLPEADHTFSQRSWADAVASRTADWLRNL